MRKVTVKSLKLPLLIAAVLLTANTSVQAAEYFRYKDASGVVVLSSTIPADRVPFGYDVVDEALRVIRSVAPQMTDAEYAAKVKREKAVAECEAQIRRVKRAYQTLEDIDLAERAALAGVTTSITNTNSNLKHVQNQRRELEAQAAQLDLEGERITEDLLNGIERARAQETNLREELASRQTEKLDQRIQYRFERKVFMLESCENGLPARFEDDSRIAASGDLSAAAGTSN